MTVVADAGSRYEVAYPSGISHFLEKLSFGVSGNFLRFAPLVHTTANTADIA